MGRRSNSYLSHSEIPLCGKLCRNVSQFSRDYVPLQKNTLHHFSRLEEGSIGVGDGSTKGEIVGRITTISPSFTKFSLSRACFSTKISLWVFASSLLRLSFLFSSACKLSSAFFIMLR